MGGADKALWIRRYLVEDIEILCQGVAASGDGPIVWNRGCVIDVAVVDPSPVHGDVGRGRWWVCRTKGKGAIRCQTIGEGCRMSCVFVGKMTGDC